MNPGILLLCLSTLFPVAAVAQDSCPLLTIDGPAGIVNVGDIATYRASLDLKSSRVTPTFRWTVSVGEIVSGQGTNMIGVRQPNACITATVDVDGFGDSCPLAVSETSCGDPSPEAVKIGEIRESTAPDLEVMVIKRFHDELANNPNNQGYVIVGHPTGISLVQMRGRERAVGDALRKVDPNFDDSRVTMAAVEKSADVVEFWRVPPGANNPTCSACLVPNVCPTITVSGPPGITEPGNIVEYSAAVGGRPTEGLSFIWTVVGGELISGQGTLNPKIKPKGLWAIQVTASLEVKGLPETCPNTASETYGVACDCRPILFDEFSIAPSKIDKRRLDALVASLTKYPGSQLHIIEYFQPRTSAVIVRRKIGLIRNYLTARGLKDSDFGIVTEASYEKVESTRLYVIPPGAELPTP
ncbi:MAG: hypothetical protein ABL984_20480 [Pyrinomonadaceae bacterium]